MGKIGGFFKWAGGVVWCIVVWDELLGLKVERLCYCIVYLKVFNSFVFIFRCSYIYNWCGDIFGVIKILIWIDLIGVSYVIVY